MTTYGFYCGPVVLTRLGFGTHCELVQTETCSCLEDRTGPILDVLPESRLHDLRSQAKSPVAQV